MNVLQSGILQLYYLLYPVGRKVECLYTLAAADTKLAITSKLQQEREKGWFFFYHMHALADEHVALVFTTHVGEKTRRKKALMLAAIGRSDR